MCDFFSKTESAVRQLSPCGLDQLPLCLTRSRATEARGALRLSRALDLTPERVSKLRSVLHYNGLPIDARSISDDVLAQEGYEVAKKNVRAGSSAGMTGGE